MRKIRTMLIAITCSALAASLYIPVSAEVKRLPSATLKSVIAEKTFAGKISGYGWGEEDDPSSLNLDITILEPIIFASAEIESLTVGDVIVIDYELYTVGSMEAEEGKVAVTPKEEWLSPITFTDNGDNTHSVENEGGVIRVDSFSFQGVLGPELVYINGDGDSLSAAELLKDISGEVIDTFSDFPEITFDENGLIAKMDFSR